MHEDESRPAQIGPYRILDVLGEGGMGTVYLAEEPQPRRRVALKLIKLGMDSKAVVARFEQERQALALMDHEGIARVYACGTTERGQPWFAMEYVKGVPLDRYCEEQKLSLKDRIVLVQQVCAAVQHAHHKGVVHRDLKPGNVLVVDEGGRRQVKVIDFGLAKAMGQRLVEATLFTEVGQVVGTPEYMAPEQADASNQDIDTRADVYSLGVMLYQVLCGELPFSAAELRAAGMLEVQRILREVDPPKPSTKLTRLGESASSVAQARRVSVGTLKKALQGDLDWVVLKALEKERNRRYDTANALAADLGRYLQNEPLEAGPPSAAYRLKKLLRRYRAQVAAAALVIAASLAFGGVALVEKARADRAALENANLAKEKGDLAEAEAKARKEAAQLAAEKGRTVENFQQLSGVVRLEDAIAAEASLWPPWPDRIGDMESWLRDHAAPLQAIKPRLDATLAELRSKALPRTPEQIEADGLASPSWRALEKQQVLVAALRRASAGPSGRQQVQPLSEEFRNQSAGMLVRSAWRLLQPWDNLFTSPMPTDVEQPGLSVGQESFAWSLAHEALARIDAGDTSVSRCTACEKLAWALFANGWLDEAVAMSDAGIAAVAPGNVVHRQEHERTKQVLLESIARLPAMRAEAELRLAELEAAVAGHRTWRFAEDAEGEADGFLHDALARLTAGIVELEHSLEPDVQRRLRWARAIEAGLCRAHPRARVTWAAAREALARADGTVASTLYAGRSIPLDEASVLGLVPLGMNPVTKLWEFYDLRSAWDGTSDPATIEIPQHRADGSIEVGERTGIVFVLLPGGKFTMGAQSMAPNGPNHEPYSRPDEAPQELELAPFFLARHELTKAQWRRLAGVQENGWVEGVRYKDEDLSIGGTHPAELMSWEAAARWMDRYGMVLPTEAQWEYGARAGTKTSWWCGARPEDVLGCANLTGRVPAGSVSLGGDGPKPGIDHFSALAPVGNFRPNPFGLFDVYGNVAEWCVDGYGPYGTHRKGDGYRLDGAVHTRVLRGGSYTEDALGARSASRSMVVPEVRKGNLGFRPARKLAM